MDNLSHRVDTKLDHFFTHLDTQLEIAQAHAAADPM
jgi:hypothetical protein